LTGPLTVGGPDSLANHTDTERELVVEIGRLNLDVEQGFKLYQINLSPEGCLESLKIFLVVLGVEQAKHDGEREGVLHEVEQAVEGQKRGVENEKFLVDAISRKPMPVNLPVRKIIRVEDDQPGEPVRVILDEAGPDHGAPVVAHEGQLGCRVVLAPGIARKEVEMSQKLLDRGFCERSGRLHRTPIS